MYVWCVYVCEMLKKKIGRRMNSHEAMSMRPQKCIIQIKMNTRKKYYRIHHWKPLTIFSLPWTSWSLCSWASQSHNVRVRGVQFIDSSNLFLQLWFGRLKVDERFRQRKQSKSSFELDNICYFSRLKMEQKKKRYLIRILFLFFGFFFYQCTLATFK